MNLKQAKALNIEDLLHHTINRNADGTLQRWRVNGKVKTWKRNPQRVEVPIKHGIWNHNYLTEDNMHLLDKA